MKPRRLTLFGRLVISMSVVAFVAICAGGIFLYLRFQASNAAFREETLSTFARDMQREFLSDPTLSGDRATALKARIKELHGEFAVLTNSGDVVISSDDLTQALVPVAEKKIQYFLLPRHNKIEPFFGISMRLSDANPPQFIQIAFPREHVIFDTVLEEFVNDIAWIWIPFVILLLIVNIVVLKLALRPLGLAAQQAREIGPSSIATRLTEEGMPEDVLAMVKAVNEALDRLQSGFLSLEQFSGHIAHEIRTPLAIIRARLSLSQDSVTREIEEDFNGIERVVSQLIDHVRIGGLHFEKSDRVDLCQLSRQVATFLAPVIIEKGRDIEVECASEVIIVNGAFDFIFRALRNLVENALNHSPASALITISVFRHGITVADAGPGYPSWRLEPSGAKPKLASSRADGLGLGLSIVEETMAAHGGTLRIANLPEGGAAATMLFQPPQPDATREA
ncbi:MAG: hypothetical protein KGI75_03685 [Rhizobiaceae bacterium]|nr:hypothetical protein [Rhizobiaceae bacterium]